MMASQKACILSVSGPALTADEAAFLAEAQPWALILMGRSCVSRVQVRQLVDDIWAALGRACLIFIDQEGGRVARLKSPEWPKFPAGAAYAELYSQDEDLGREATYLGYRLIADELSSMGIHADCAPVLDVPVPGAHDIIGDRAFGHNARQVANLGKAVLKGLSDGGVAGVIKHMPGHGRAEADSHHDLPRVTAGDNELAADFTAFSDLADAPMAMSAHIAYTSIDGETPATLSSKTISEVIRGRIGFDGLLMTDDLGMRALGGSLAARAEAAIGAGCDVILHCAGFTKAPEDILAEMVEVAGAVPALEGRALERAIVAEASTSNAKSFDRAAAWHRFNELFPDLNPSMGAAA